VSSDLTRVLFAWLTWIAVPLGVFFLLAAVLPGLPPMLASLWIIAVVSVLLAGGITALGWWRDVGFTAFRDWRQTGWIVLPGLLTLLPLVAGIKPIDPSSTDFLLPAMR